MTAPRPSDTTLLTRTREIELDGVLAESQPPDSLYARHVKDIADRVIALLLLLVALPLLAVIALAILLTLGRPILYRQQRIGQYGRPFEMLKFRTMRPDRRAPRSGDYDGPDRRVRHKNPDDPRHTPLGRFLRRYSLDELPQLWQVVRGDLSLIGPRPELATVVEREYEPWQHQRHLVKPGLTGLWQVTERDEQGYMHLHVDTDLRYIRELSPSLDLRILARTIPVLLGIG